MDMLLIGIGIGVFIAATYIVILDRRWSMKLSNLSDGASDGIVLFYMKDGRLKPVAITKEQVKMLDLVLAIPFKESKLLVGNNNIDVRNGIVQG